VSDEYIYEIIEGELVRQCPGSLCCHGSLKWCPLCGDCGYVCDDPQCDTHPRREDLRASLEVLDRELRKTAEKAREAEIVLLQSEEPDKSLRHNLRHHTSWYASLENDTMEEEEELRKVLEAGPRIVPRRTEERTEMARDTGQLELPFG